MSGTGATERISKIFVCYRRADSAEMVGRIFDNLLVDFGPYAIFRDVNSITTGTDFRSQLEKTIPRCALMLVLVGREWLAATPGSRSRLFDPDDAVRLEIEVALRARVPILCVLVAGAVKPKRNELPSPIRALCDGPFVKVRSDRNFQRDFRRLSKLCIELSKGKSPVRPLPLPDLDEDSRTTVRILAAMGLRLQEAIVEVAKDEMLYQPELNRDSTDLLAIDCALHAWRRYIGDATEREMDVENLPALSDPIEAVLAACDGGIDEAAWQCINEKVRRDFPDAGTLSTMEERAAVIGSSSILKDFELIRRSTRRVTMPEDIVEILEALGSELLSPAVHKIFVTWDRRVANPTLDRILDDLRVSLGHNAILARDGAKNLERVVRSCNTCLVLIGATLMSEGGHQELETEFQAALRSGLQIVPVVLPGTSVPRASSLPEHLQPLLGFKCFEVRSDPGYAPDIERLVAACRSQVHPLFRIGMLPLPTQLPLHAQHSVNSLVRACDFLRALLVELAQGEISMQGLSEEGRAGLRSVNITLNQWGKYFSLIPTDRWLDADGISYRPQEPAKI